MHPTAAPPWPETTYRLDLPHPVPDELSWVAWEVFTRVWRTTVTQPGFAVVRFGGPLTSLELRSVMIRLLEALPERFLLERVGRFDQQVTSRFHRDGAPPASLLLLGYEPSPVRSRVFVADPYLAAMAAGLGVAEFLAAFNPMLPDGETRLWPFATELALGHNEPCLVLINNSLVPNPVDGQHPLGLLHKAELPAPDPTAQRVINSLGLIPASHLGGSHVSATAVTHFLTRLDLD